MELHGSSGDDAQDMTDRELLIESSLPQIFDEYDFARRHALADPVVFLIDCEDEIGSPMARAWEGDDEVDAAIMANLTREESLASEQKSSATERPARSDADRLITTLARAFPLKECRREVPDVFPYLAETVAGPPPADGFLAIVVTAGGAAIFTVPLSARPEPPAHAPN